jgi:hypothetical protein
VRSRHQHEGGALRELLRGTYRGARASVASRVESLDAREVTLSTDIAILRATTTPA